MSETRYCKGCEHSEGAHYEDYCDVDLYCWDDDVPCCSCPCEGFVPQDEA